MNVWKVRYQYKSNQCTALAESQVNDGLVITEKRCLVAVAEEIMAQLGSMELVDFWCQWIGHSINYHPVRDQE